MKLRKLEELLGEVDTFPHPKIKLEQYPTSPHIAAHMVYTVAQSYGEVEDRVIADLGCGCGMLSIAAQLMGSGCTVGLDIDGEALVIAQQNAIELELADHTEWVQCDVATLLTGRFKHKVDTVIMNPPFGTKNKGIDLVFLEKALHMAEISVYSLHKSSTRSHIARKADRQWNVRAEVVAQLRFDIPQMYRFHKRESVDVEVDFWRFEPILDTSKALS